jgi:outer membrane receptor protein involved in Fe transport
VQPIYDNFNSSFNRQPGDYAFGQLRDFLVSSANTYTSTFPDSDTPRSLKNWLISTYVQDNWQAANRLTLNAGLRYEISTVPTEKHGRTARLDGLFDPTATIDDIVVGDPMYENPSLRNFAPRVGFAWDVNGDGRTAVRGGVGVFYDLVQQLIYRQAWNRTPPFHTWGTARTTTVGPIDFPNSYVTQTQLLASSIAIDTIAFEFDQPTVVQYGVGIQRELRGLTLEAQYSGKRGYNLIGGTDINQRVPEVLPDGRLFFGPNAPIFNPAMERIRVRMSDVDSWYNAVLLGARHRYRNGMEFQVAYTISKALDTGSSTGGTDFGNDDIGTIRAAPPGFVPRLDNRGLTAFDVRQNLVINGSVELPVRLSGAAGAILGGWSVNGILKLASGVPMTPMGSRSSSGRNVRRWGEVGGGPPDLVPGREANSISPQNPNQYFDPTAFVLPAPGFFGNLGRSTVIAPGMATVDLSLFKQFRLGALGEQGRLQFRAEIFNLFNRPNFGLPNATLFDATTGQVLATAGRITSTSTRAREMQFGIKLMM